MERLAHPVNETRQLLGGISRQTIYRDIAAGKLEAIKIGGRTLITADSIRRRIETAKRVAA